MKDEYLEFSVLLEKTVAGFYENLKSQDKLGRIKQVLEFMETHSLEHSKRLAEVSQNTDKPALGESMILDYQNKVIKKVHDKIEGERDLLKILQILADSEDKLGSLYTIISETSKSLSQHYLHIADTFRDIADDEFRHRDILLADKKRLEKKADGNS